MPQWRFIFMNNHFTVFLPKCLKYILHKGKTFFFNLLQWCVMGTHPSSLQLNGVLFTLLSMLENWKVFTNLFIIFRPAVYVLSGSFPPPPPHGWGLRPPMPHPLNSHYLGWGVALATIPRIVDDSVDRITVPPTTIINYVTQVHPTPPNSGVLFQNTSCTVVDVFYGMMSTQAALCIYTLWLS